ncbi:hypothetical protein HMPREF1861_00273 [Corynebacterium kroppenstedtii]|nr:hypothetical protein HMPREF1861_00273 [Corynebacterium kroppenstedtii]
MEARELSMPLGSVPQLKAYIRAADTSHHVRMPSHATDTKRFGSRTKGKSARQTSARNMRKH